LGVFENSHPKVHPKNEICKGINRYLALQLFYNDLVISSILQRNDIIWNKRC